MNEKGKIKNIVFDFGQVLVYFQPEYMTGVYVTDPDDKALLCEVVFDRLYWDRLDAGTITNEETLTEIKKRLPERLHEVSEKIYWNWIYNIPEIEGMSDLIKHLKNNHRVSLFVLSNISHYFADHADEIPILKQIPNRIFSARIGITKPKREIFATLCEKFDLNPAETIFIDDNENNVKGALDFGLNAYLFDGSAEKLKSYLDSVLD